MVGVLRVRGHHDRARPALRDPFAGGCACTCGQRGGKARRGLPEGGIVRAAAGEVGHHARALQCTVQKAAHLLEQRCVSGRIIHSFVDKVLVRHGRADETRRDAVHKAVGLGAGLQHHAVFVVIRVAVQRAQGAFPLGQEGSQRRRIAQRRVLQPCGQRLHSLPGLARFARTTNGKRRVQGVRVAVLLA